MDRKQAIREGERAAIERWFPSSPLGPLFDPGDGRLLPTPTDTIASSKDQAFAIVDSFLAASRAQEDHMKIFLCIAVAGAVLMGFAGFRSGYALVAGIGAGAALLHAHSFYRFWRYRRDLAALRQRVLASLACRSPLPHELASRYRRRNMWRTALHIWVWALALSALAVQHFLPPEQMPPALIPAALAAVAVGWGLYFLARRVDLRHGS
jgi:hypothetical protein